MKMMKYVLKYIQSQKHSPKCINTEEAEVLERNKTLAFWKRKKK